MFGKKLYFSWIVCSVLMFLLSYVWHGVVLNDFSRISYPLDTFLTLAAIVYLGIGGIIALMISLADHRHNLIFKSILAGATTGLFIYLIAFVFGISFSVAFVPKYIVIDAAWQIIEQGTGGAVGGAVYGFFLMREKFSQNQ